ncbi:MAG: bifunctional [glutamate--ammonia ligase]-adenylyl-L-tyrosine phosphorylase/[glutamate--ammonia-ligase] adenylyltransferase [Candidatus Brocadiales bacterium]|nr:bifunctional [glutamate--ammonia ligase]-adenylyl-L-tyrosine phosphorylase/[glutamate--ammonia-ligase] adenylyltransferase [Candidatus Bathyanammoxibius amoris]
MTKLPDTCSLELRDIVLGEEMEESRVSAALRGYGLQNARLARKNLKALAGSLPKAELFLEVLPFLTDALKDCPDPDAALNNMERFAAACCSGMNLYSYMRQNPSSVYMLVGLFGSSQAFSNTLIRNPEYFYWLSGLDEKEKFASKDGLRRVLFSEIDVLQSFDKRLNTLRRFKRRELLRIGYLDLVLGASLSTVTKAITDLAEVEAQAALRVAHEQLREKFQIKEQDPEKIGFVVIAMGKLGGEELNYSSDIDIIFVYSPEGLGLEEAAAAEYYHRLAEQVVHLLRTSTSEGYVFRVDTRLRPEGRFGPLVRSLNAYCNYYQTQGSTWERQALIKARPVAGNMPLGKAFMESITPFVYQRFLRLAEINEIKRLKRRIESVVEKKGEAHLEVKTGFGGIRDVEFTVQFLQLFHGGLHPDIRHHNTLRSLELLEETRCLEPHERKSLEESYTFLRTLEHRLQTMHELQVHKFSPDVEEQRKLALKLGFRDTKTATAQERFQKELGKHTRRTNRILNNLFHNLFGEEGEASAPEVDLILDPEHTVEQMESMLAKYNFKDLTKAHRNIELLSREAPPLHDSPRTRAFFASMAPSLLSMLKRAPDPDMALNNLERCTASLGAKTIFFQMLVENPQALEVFVDLCAWSQFLSDILIKNPGMVDQLIDSLIIGEHKDTKEMTAELSAIMAHAPDTLRCLHGYKNQEILRIGVRDILGKADMKTTMEDLSGLAEAVLVNAFHMCAKGVDWEGDAPEFGVLALGKLGGREMCYSSDIDVVFVYREAKGPKTGVSNQLTDISHRLMKALGEMTEWGTLYRMDTRLRPEGRGGILVTSLDSFAKYYSGGAGLWEKQALTKARWIAGDEGLGREVMGAVEECIYAGQWRPEMVDEIAEMRGRMEQSTTGKDIKRGFGGIVDIEFIAQLLQLKYGGDYPDIRTPNTLDALHNIYDSRLMEEKHYKSLVSAYKFLRKVESRLRIVHDITQDKLPESHEALDKLAKRLGYSPDEIPSPAEGLLADNESHTSLTREIFREICDVHRHA